MQKDNTARTGSTSTKIKVTYTRRITRDCMQCTT